MYRLHNNTIEEKIDWLVKNKDLLAKKIFVSPCDEYGLQCMRYLRDKWGKDVIFLDKEVSKYNNKVLGYESIENNGGEVYLVFAISDFSILSELETNKISEEQIYILKGDPLRGQDCLLKCCNLSNIHSVLDIGGGKGNHANIFSQYGKEVTLIDAGYTCSPKGKDYSVIIADFESYTFEQKFDLIWCCHILEHQLNIERFVKKLFECVNDDGYVAITVPNNTNGWVIEGHVTFWNVGQLMCNIIHCGYSCKNAMAKTYYNNASVIVPKEPINNLGDYRALVNTRMYYPEKMICGKNRYGGVYFDGNIMELNWE